MLVTEFIKNACAKQWDNYGKFVWGWIAAAREIEGCVWEKISAVFRKNSLLRRFGYSYWDAGLRAVVQPRHLQGCCQRPSTLVL